MRHSVQILCVSDRGGGVCVCVWGGGGGGALTGGYSHKER